jgi:hypothetical protein
MVWELAIHEVAKQSWPLKPEDTWRAIIISLTCSLEESKEYDRGTRDMIKVVHQRERSGPLI